MNDTKKKTNLEITQVINQPYKYGFETQVEKEDFPVGMNEEILKLLSEKKKNLLFYLIFV
jgi:Fe-S cluster assembly protein SufB